MFFFPVTLIKKTISPPLSTATTKAILSSPVKSTATADATGGTRFFSPTGGTLCLLLHIEGKHQRSPSNFNHKVCFFLLLVLILFSGSLDISTNKGDFGTSLGHWWNRVCLQPPRLSLSPTLLEHKVCSQYFICQAVWVLHSGLKLAFLSFFIRFFIAFLCVWVLHLGYSFYIRFLGF